MEIEVGREDPRQRPGYYLETEAQCRNKVLDLVAQVEALRQQCDVALPDPGNEILARVQRKAYTELRIRYGFALGTLVTMHQARLVSDVLYNELRDRVARTMVPTVVSGLSTPLVPGPGRE